MIGNEIPDEFLEMRLRQKRLIEKTKNDDRIVYSSTKKGNTINHPIQALLMWNKYISASNASYDNNGRKNISEVRLFALYEVIKRGGLDAIFNYFKNSWPHLVCCNRPCHPRMIEIIFKLSHSNYFVTINGKHHEPLRPKYKSISGWRQPAKVELQISLCAFHPDKKAVNLAGQSKTPICALCRSRIANGVQNGEINKIMREEEIFLWVKLKADIENKKRQS